VLERSLGSPALVGVGGAGPPGLPEIGAEVEAIVSRFPAAEVAEEARVDDVRRLLQTCDAVHIASHGAFQPLFPAGSGIRLADGWLTAMDLVQLETRARFVSLGSCSSGQVAVSAGEELMGVVRALFEGGADTALLAPGALDDHLARLTAQLFFEHLLDLGPGEALRTTLNQLREEHPHPALWAGFQLYGNPRAWEMTS
jgi:CHAT domain-containing protein